MQQHLTDIISKVILVDPVTSWLSIATNRFYDPALVMSSVPGALKEYDLPDLEASLSARRLVIITHLSDALEKTASGIGSSNFMDSIIN